MKLEQIIKPKAIADILGISASAVYSKLKQENGNRFSKSDIEKIKEKVKRLI